MNRTISNVDFLLVIVGSKVFKLFYPGYETFFEVIFFKKIRLGDFETKIGYKNRKPLSGLFQ